MENKIKIFWLVENQGNGHYVTQDYGDYETEFYVEGSWTKKLYNEECMLTEIEKKFNEEDADYDYSRMIMLVIDLDNNILYDRSHKSSKYQKDRLIEKAESMIQQILARCN